jgi:trimethylamine--corrinoid protein Co-methyltransferase
VHLGTGGAAVKILDLDTGEAAVVDTQRSVRPRTTGGRLDHIHFFLRPCIPTDIPEADYDVNMFYACLKATGKHVMSGVNDEAGLHRIIDMAAMLAGGKGQLQEKPFISMITSFSISPLKLCTQSTRIMQECNRQGIPVALSAAPMSGSTSPMTMAGTLAQLHAEQLAGITICQLTRPVRPAALRRHSRHGQHGHHGLPGRWCGMRHDECGHPPDGRPHSTCPITTPPG